MAKKCDCCGAPLHGNVCDYCGAEFDITDLGITKKAQKVPLSRDSSEKAGGNATTSVEAAAHTVRIEFEPIKTDVEKKDHSNMIFAISIIVLGFIAAGIIITIVNRGELLVTALYKIPLIAQWHVVYVSGSKIIAVLGMICVGGVILGGIGAFVGLVKSFFYGDELSSSLQLIVESMCLFGLSMTTQVLLRSLC